MEDMFDELDDLYTDDVVVERYQGSDEYGTPNAYGDPFTVRGRITGRTKVVLDTDGRERVSNVQFSTRGFHNLRTEDRYTLPLDYTTDPENPGNLVARQPRALGVDTTPDENGPHHQIIHFANTRVRTF